MNPACGRYRQDWMFKVMSSPGQRKTVFKLSGHESKKPTLQAECSLVAHATKHSNDTDGTRDRRATLMKLFITLYYKRDRVCKCVHCVCV